MSEIMNSNAKVNYIKPADENNMSNAAINCFIDDVDFVNEENEIVKKDDQNGLEEDGMKIERTSIDLLRKIWKENKNMELKLLENIDLTTLVASSPQPNDELKNFPLDRSHILLVNETSVTSPTRLIALSPDYILEFPPSPIASSPLSYSVNNLRKFRPKFGDIIKICLLNNTNTSTDEESPVNGSTNFTPFITNTTAASKHPASKKSKRKNRSMSESYCDVIKDVAEQLNDLKLTSKIDLEDNDNVGDSNTDGFKKQKLRKSRSLSESGNDDDPINSKCKIRKYKGILKHTVYSDSIIFETSEEDISMSADWTDKMRTDDEDHSSGDGKKSVRFSDVIKKQLFRVNSSILGQKKKNHKKSLQRKRALDRKLSESENSECDEKHSSKVQNRDKLLNNRNV